MGYEKINTTATRTTAEHLASLNNAMRSRFPEVQTAVNRLASAWDGVASDNAIRKFNELASKHPEARYQAMNNYVNFLFRQVSEGYEQTESANVKLSEAFK